jgi:hypothetical protein
MLILPSVGVVPRLLHTNNSCPSHRDIQFRRAKTFHFHVFQSLLINQHKTFAVSAERSVLGLRRRGARFNNKCQIVTRIRRAAGLLFCSRAVSDPRALAFSYLHDSSASSPSALKHEHDSYIFDVGFYWGCLYALSLRCCWVATRCCLVGCRWRLGIIWCPRLQRWNEQNEDVDEMAWKW